MGHVKLEMPTGHSIGDMELAVRFPSVKFREVIKVKEIHLRAILTDALVFYRLLFIATRRRIVLFLQPKKLPPPKSHYLKVKHHYTRHQGCSKINNLLYALSGCGN